MAIQTHMSVTDLRTCKERNTNLITDCVLSLVKDLVALVRAVLDTHQLQLCSDGLSDKRGSRDYQEQIDLHLMRWVFPALRISALVFDTFGPRAHF